MLFGIRPRFFVVLRGPPTLALPLLPPAEVALLYASAGLGKNASRVGDEIGEVGEVEGGSVRGWGV